MPNKPKYNLRFQRFGRLFVIRRGDKIPYGRGMAQRWYCRCDCGRRKNVLGINLIAGRSTSCGCLTLERAREVLTKHGHSRRIGEYDSWSHMIQRCTNPKNKDYRLYGERGISVYVKWLEFSAFIADVGLKPTPAHTLDRYPNNDGNYEPGNVRWATRKEQANNRRKAA